MNGVPISQLHAMARDRAVAKANDRASALPLIAVTAPHTTRTVLSGAQRHWGRALRPRRPRPSSALPVASGGCSRSALKTPKRRRVAPSRPAPRLSSRPAALAPPSPSPLPCARSGSAAES